MTWTFSENLDAYLGAAGEVVAAYPVENTLLLTVVASLRRHGRQAYGDRAPLFGWWRDAGGAVRGAAVWTPPHPLIVGTVPVNAVAPLARACEKYGVPAVNADGDAAGLLAAEWPVHRISMRQRLYRLDGLIPASPPPAGHARRAGVADRELLVGWYQAFGRDTGVQVAGAGAAVDDRLSHGGLMLWEHGGVPVSMAGAGRPAEGTVRVAPVYTPPEHRGRGYAGAVTEALSRSELAAGAADVLLFTDLANPTSNGIYQRIGYRPVRDRVVMTMASTA